MFEKVSIIIPTTRLELVKKVIESVLDQRFPQAKPEIIIVGQGANLLKKIFKIRTIDQGALSPPGKARNLGAKIAKGEILIFLDDDCLPQKNWLKENIAAFKDKDTGAVGGMISGKSERYFAKCLDFSNFTFAQSTQPKEMPICAASLAIKKEVFQKVGGFNEEMRVGEDTDLCLRLQRQGFKTIYNPRIKVWHEHRRESLKELLRYQYNNGRTKGLIIENRYPDNFWFAFLKKISHPAIYWFFILPFALLATLVALLINLLDSPKVVFYLPGIFVGKFSCQVGIFVWTLKRSNL